MPPSVKHRVSRNPETVRARILDAAQAEFLAEGYGAASTNRILERFGGSKPTMFRHFPTKLDMYHAVVARFASRWSDEIDVNCIQENDPQTWLTEFGATIALWCMRDENLFLARMAILEGADGAAAAELYRLNAASPIEHLLAAKLAEWAASGQLTLRDAQRDAVCFLDLTVSGLVFRRLFGANHGTPIEAVRKQVAHAVSLFLDGRLPRLGC